MIAGLLGAPYVSEEAAQKLKEYQYPGTVDESPWYNYVLVPASEWTVKRFPRWLAPNTITTTGLAAVVFATMVMTYYCPRLEGVAPSWVYWLAGLSMLFYQFLDVCDGKQARRTGTGSPLGLLFDHGIDAFNVIVGAVAISSTLQMGATWRAPALASAAQVAFFFGTWQEYHTGILYLPPFNGPNEGLLIIIATHLYTAIYGPGLWTQPCPFYPELPNNTVILLMTMTGTVINVVINMITVVKHVKENPQKGFSPARALWQLWPYLTLLASFTLYIHLSPANMMYQHPQLVMWATGILQCKLIMHMMLAHLCDCQFNLMRKTLVPIFIIGIHASIQCVTGIFPEPHCIQPLAEESTIAIALAILIFVTYLHMVVHLVWEITAVLGIHCFTVPPAK